MAKNERITKTITFRNAFKISTNIALLLSYLLYTFGKPHKKWNSKVCCLFSCIKKELPHQNYFHGLIRIKLKCETH